MNARLAVNDGATILGNRLVNPYTVANMKTAKENLAASGIFPKQDFTVRETHLYVKFKPKSEEEYDKLTADNSLDLIDFPMDYDIKMLGSWYRESGLDESVPTPQYSTVSDDFVFNDEIEYEVIESMYPPELDYSLLGSRSSEDYAYLRQLLNEAYRLTGNPVDNSRWVPVETGANDPVSGGGPDGFVNVFDTRLSRTIPLKGADILVSNGMSFYHGTTDNNGQYWLDNWFQGNSIVLVKMRKNDFTIRSSFFDNAYVARLSNSTYCDVDIENGMERMYATMFRAAYRYYYGEVGGLQRPNRALFSQVLVGKDESGTSSGINYVVWPSLKVWRYRSNSVEYGTDEIFSTTIHELAHTAHVKTMNLGVLNYAGITNIIRESWPVAVEWFITGMEYRELGIGNYGDRTYNPIPAPQYPNQFAYQYWNPSVSSDYTNLFIDLVDNFNENGISFGWQMGTVNDQVSGYTLSGIESTMLKYVHTVHPNPSLDLSLSTYLKANKPNGVTDTQIDLLLNSF